MEKWKRSGETTVSANQPVFNLLLLELQSSAYLGSRKLQIHSFFPIQAHNWNVLYLSTRAGTNVARALRSSPSFSRVIGYFCTFTSSYLCEHQERACLLRIRGWRPLCHCKIDPGGNIEGLTFRSPEPHIQFYSHTWKALRLIRQFLSFWKRKPAG